MQKTKISWAEMVWNPVTGCDPVSEGCLNCYAKKMSIRLRGRCGYPKDDPFKVVVHFWRDEEPFKYKKPKRIFVCSMGDLFHEKVPMEMIDRVLEVIRECKQHTFLVLTKRPQNFSGSDIENLYFGVSVENQRTADERIPILLQIPAKHRWLSIEPLLGPVDISSYIGLYPMKKGDCHETNVERRNSISGSEEGRLGNRPGGTNLENNDKEGNKVGEGCKVGPMQEEKSGTRHGNILSNTGDGKLETDILHGPSSRLVSLQRTDTRRVDCQSQERDKERELARESGISNILPTDRSCDGRVGTSQMVETTRRGGQSQVEIDDRSRIGDQQTPGGYSKGHENATREDDNTISEEIRGGIPNDLGRGAKSEMEISFVVVGAETGPGARPMDLDWARDLLAQCRVAGVPFFMKRTEGKGSFIPDDLNIRELPRE